MNMHKNARTTPHSRVLMMKRIEEGWSVKMVARAAGVSVRTVYKWLARYRNEGPAGLSDRPSPAITVMARLAACKRRICSSLLARNRPPASRAMISSWTTKVSSRPAMR
ncbi:MAG: leucine zipper domain-containing protein [Burkholderiales bacterium]